MGIVGAKRFLVDVLFKDVAQHMRADLVVAPSWRIIQVPGVAREQGKQVFKCLVRDVNVRPAFLKRMQEKESPVQIDHLPKHVPGHIASFVFGLCKPLKKEQLEKLAIVQVRPPFATFGQLILQIILVPIIKKPLAL